MSTSITAALVGRNAIIREGLNRILSEQGFEVRLSVDCAATLATCLPDNPVPKDMLIIADLGIDEDAEDMVTEIQSSLPDARVVLLADQFEFDRMLGAFQAGAQGYLVKEISCEPLIASLHLAASGEKVLPSQLVSRLPTKAAALATGPLQRTIQSAHLSERETEILRCLIMGHPNKVISRQLDISEATVKVHVKAILRKSRVHNRTQAAIWAVNCGLEGLEQTECNGEAGWSPQQAQPDRDGGVFHPGTVNGSRSSLAL